MQRFTVLFLVTLAFGYVLSLSAPAENEPKQVKEEAAGGVFDALPNLLRQLTGDLFGTRSADHDGHGGHWKPWGHWGHRRRNRTTTTTTSTTAATTTVKAG